VAAALAAVVTAIALASRDGNDSVTQKAAVTSPTPPPLPDAALTVAPTGDDASVCETADPCLSLKRAAELARPGDHVQIRGGRYPYQIIPKGTGGTPDDPVIFTPAPGEAVTIAELEIEGRGIEVRDVTISTNWYVLPGAADITVRDVDTPQMIISSASRVQVLGGRIGPLRNFASAIKIYDQGFSRPADITLDGVSFENYTRDPGTHTECLQAWSVDRLVIRNSRFRTCAVFAISIDNLHDEIGARDVLIENNWFDCTSTVNDCSYNIGWGKVSRLTVRNNSFRGRAISPFDPAHPEGEDVLIVANIGPDPKYCDVPGEIFRYNVWEGRACDPSDTDAPNGYLDGAAFDLRLADGAAAIGHGDPETGPPTDIDGTPRPQGSAPDAGASERS
jgi:hypothetical protein